MNGLPPKRDCGSNSQIVGMASFSFCSTYEWYDVLFAVGLFVGLQFSFFFCKNHFCLYVLIVQGPSSEKNGATSLPYITTVARVSRCITYRAISTGGRGNIECVSPKRAGLREAEMYDTTNGMRAQHDDKSYNTYCLYLPGLL